MKRVLITRPESRAREWLDGFRSAGWSVVHFPVFALALPDAQEIQRTLHLVEETARRESPWLAFTSVSAVEHLCELLQSAGSEDLLAAYPRIEPCSGSGHQRQHTPMDSY